MVVSMNNNLISIVQENIFWDVLCGWNVLSTLLCCKIETKYVHLLLMNL